MTTKQVIVMRTDLNMRKGKMVAQGAHASMGAVLPYVTLAGFSDSVCQEWLAGPFTKVCLRVDSEEELVKLYDQAKTAGLITCLITDSGKTEFHGVPTRTCIAIGPGIVEDIDAITGHLKLL